MSLSNNRGKSSRYLEHPDSLRDEEDQPGSGVEFVPKDYDNHFSGELFCIGPSPGFAPAPAIEHLPLLELSDG